LSADSHYLDWLQGRHRDRGPAYSRIKKILTARLSEEMHGKVQLPHPAWASR
jgi:hypothetical protein